MPRRRPLLDTPLKWVGTITAVVSLVLGLNQVTRLFSEIRERQRQIAELRTVAEEQQRAGDYPAAWASIDRALNAADQGGYLAKMTGRVGEQRGALRDAQENVAMAWLENIRVPEGKRFSDVVDPLVPILTRGAVSASRVRKADLLAHVGWAYFLKSRDSGEGVNPAQYYQQAIEIDPGNPYAHAHWGHWIIWRREKTEDANTHFVAAVAAGRERAYVRRIQLAALRSYSSSANESAFLRAVHEMVANKETIDDRARSDVYATYFFAFNSTDGFERLIAAIPAKDQIAIIRALFFDADFDPSKMPLRDASVAILQEAAGQPDEALKTWRALRERLRANADGRVVERANAAIKRLSASNAAKRT